MEDDPVVVGELMLYLFRGAAQPFKDQDIIKFGQLKTDECRIKYLLEQDHIHELLEIEPEFVPKNVEEAIKERESGNKHFAKKNFKMALMSYNKAVMKAPFDDDLEADDKKELVLALANRSAALLHARQFHLCLRDIDLALENGYPENMHYKLYDRKAKVFQKLKDPTQAVTYFLKALQLLEQSKLDDKGKQLWTATLNKQMKQCDMIIPEKQEITDKRIPRVVGELSETHPRASVAVDYKYTTTKDEGRHAVAKQNIRVGSVLVQEKPFASVLLSPFYDNHCYHCQKFTFAPVPDYKWNNMGFCSEDCRHNAWLLYHKHEYPYQNVLGKEYCAKIGQLAFRVISSFGYSNVKAYMLAARDQKEVAPEELGFTENGVYSDGFPAIYNMEVNMARRVPDGIIDFGVFAIFLLKVLQRTDFFAEETETKIDGATKNGEALVMIGAALLKTLEVIQCNGIGVQEIQYPLNFEESCPETIAMAIYPTAALFNHSCDPNADLNFYDNTLVLRATRNIKTEQKINIDYGMVFYKNPKVQRQGTLNYRYCFQCQCIACTEEWGLYRDLEAEIPNFRCEECGRALPMGNLVDNRYLRCTKKKCNNLQDIQTNIGKLGVSHDVYAAAMEMAISGYAEKAIPDLQSHLTLTQLVLLPPWKDLAICQAGIKQCYRLSANIKQFF